MTDELELKSTPDGFCILARPVQTEGLSALSYAIRMQTYPNANPSQWLADNDLHVTLVYATGLGDIAAVSNYLSQIKSVPIVVTVDHIGAFDTPDGKVIYAGVRKDAGLAALQSGLAESMKVAGYTLSPFSEPADYTPHFTLGTVSPDAPNPPIVAPSIPMTLALGQIEFTNPDHLMVIAKLLYEDTPMPDTKDVDLDAVKTLTFGSEVKFTADGMVEGYLVLFGSPEQADFDGDFFTKDTDFDVDWQAPEEIKSIADETYGSAEILGTGGRATTYFNHGLDPVIGKHKLDGGRKATLTMTDKGIWIQSRLREGDQYDEMVKELMKVRQQRGRSPGWSSGAPGHLVEKQRVKSSTGIEANWIKTWPLGADGSITHTPNDYRNIGTLKTLAEFSQAVIAEQGSEYGSDGADVSGRVEPTTKAVPTFTENTDMNTRIVEVALNAVIEGLKLTLSAEQRAAAKTQAIAALKATNDCPPDDEDCGDDAQAMKAVQSPEFVKQLADIAVSVKTLQEERISDNIKATLGGFQPVPQSQVGGYQKPVPALQISMKTKYGDLKAADMNFIAWWMSKQASAKNGQWRGSEAFWRELADKTTKAVDTGELQLPYEGGQAPRALKMVNAIKTNEVDSASQAGFGDEWTPDLWSAELWMKDRLPDIVWSQFRPIDMPSSPYELPIETTDPTVYRVPETTNQSQLSLADTTTFTLSKVATDKKTITAYKLGLQTAYSAELNEDSIIQFAPELRYQAMWAINNAREYVILQADATTGSNVNINKSDASVSSSDLDRWLLGSSGVAYLPLITDTTRTINNGNSSPTLQGLRSLRGKFQAARIGQLDNLIYVTDPVTALKLLNIDEVVTLDKYGPQATVLNGEIGKIDNIPVLQTANWGLSLNTGKLSNTAASNTFGRILLIHKPSYRVGYRRQVEMGVDYIRWRDVFVLTSTVRMGIVQRDTDASAIMYNIAV